MKRLNPSTGEIFKRGDTREDGYRFWVYTKRLKADGFFTEQWYKPESFDIQTRLSIKSAVIYNKQNPELLRKRIAHWSNANKDKKNASLAKRRSAKLKRTPNWLNLEHFEQISDFYTVAKMFQMYTGELYHVDHIVPLQGENVSGLHVPWNLQVLPVKENLSKGNKYGI